MLNLSYKPKLTIKEKENNQNIKKKIAILSGKGGVGKSTVSVNLACALAKKGYKVGLLDADLHGPNVLKMISPEKKVVLLADPEKNKIYPYVPPYLENLKVISIAAMLPSEEVPVIWRGPLKHKALEQFIKDVDWGELDFLIIDLPPGTGDEVLSISQILKPLDGFLIVVTPQEVALSDGKKAIKFAQMIGVPVLGIIENMSYFICPKCKEISYIFKTGGGKKLASEYNLPLLGQIPLDLKVVDLEDKGHPPIIFAPESEFSKAFENIVNKLKLEE